jgi:hypothetical protein
MSQRLLLARSGRWAKQRRQLSSNNRNLHVLPDLLERWAASSALPPVTTFAFNCPSCGSREVILIFLVAREPDYIAARRA